MKYLEITLSGFKRIAVTGHDTISIKPHSPLQLILGTNGSGKSQLMKEITPMPANKDAFNKEGFKRIVIEHNKEIYTLTTTFKNGTKCSFLRHSDSEELNPGGTQSVQIDLIHEIFNFTQISDHLLHGQQIFTSMAPLKRRDYFTDLSSVDYTYALGVWSKLKDGLRDIQGAIKNAKKRIVEESQQSHIEGYEEALDIQIKQKEQSIQKLMGLIAPHENIMQQSLNQHLMKSDQLADQINQSALSLKKAKRYLESHGNSLSKVDLENELQLVLDRLNELDGKLAILYQEYDRTQQKVNALAKDNSHDVQKLTQDLSHLGNRLTKLYIDEHEFIEHHRGLNQHEVNGFIHLTKEVLERIDDFLVNDLFPKESELLDEAAYQRLVEQKTLLEQNIHELHERSLKGSTVIEEMLRHKQNGQNTCPKCQHTWIPGYDDNKLLMMKRKLEEINLTKSVKESELTKAINEINQQNEKMTLVKRYHQFLKSYREKLTYLYRDLGSIKFDPMAFQQLAINYQYLLNTYWEQLTIKAEMDKVQGLLNLAQKSDQSLLDNESKKLKEIEEQVTLLSTDKKSLMESKRSLEIHISAINALEKHSSSLSELLTSFDENNITCLNRVMVKSLQESLDKERVALGELIKERNNLEVKSKILTRLNQELNELQEEEQHLKYLVDELSPTHGLIADNLLGFIKAFLTEMNNIIKQIWSYPLSIKLPDFEPGMAELNYKFPMMIGHGEENIIPDVSMGSTGIKEVVDLAFKLTAMKVSGIGNYPLFLDEFGASFDEKHRAQAAHVIKSIMEQKSHKQLFMVSHYVDSYGSLVNADVIVLNPDNIALPTKNYNEYTTFTLENNEE